MSLLRMTVRIAD